MPTTTYPDLTMGTRKGVEFFCTTAGATCPEEEVPDNPLLDQVNVLGGDPEEPDSDMEGESSESTTLTSQNQHGNRGATESVHTQRAKNADLSLAVSVNYRLPQCDIGAIELLTFFPNHTQWPEAGLRLYRNGWSSTDIARMQLFARGVLNALSLDRRVSAMRHQVVRNGQIFFEDSKFTQRAYADRMTVVTSYNATSYAPRPSERVTLKTATLVDLAQGVVHWPGGEDRGLITQTIEYAHQHGLAQYTVDDIPRLAQQLGATAPSKSNTTQRDQNALRRSREAVEQA